MNFRSPYLALGGTALAALGSLLAVGSLQREDPKSASAGRGAVFLREADDLRFNLSYGWTDFKGTARRVSFSIGRKDLSDAESEFGYTAAELEAHLSSKEWTKKASMIAELKSLLGRHIAGSGYAAYIRVVDTGELSFSLKLNAPSELKDEVQPAFDALKSKLSEEYVAGVRRIVRELEEERKIFLESRGIEEKGGTIRVLYKQSVRNNRPRVRPALESLRLINAKFSVREFLALSLSFIQEVAYGLPPLVDGQRHILGFWVPPRVLADNLGDCDSKGAALAALWANLKKYPVILIKVPDHMFVGVGIPSFLSEGITINGVHYTLCEVTGGQKIPPGFLTVYSLNYLRSGRYQYELVTD